MSSYPSGPRCLKCRGPCHGDRNLYARCFTVVGHSYGKKKRHSYSLFDDALHFMLSHPGSYHSICMDTGKRYVNHVEPQNWILLIPREKYWKMNSTELKSLAHIHPEAYRLCIEALEGKDSDEHHKHFFVRIDNQDGQKMSVKCYTDGEFAALYTGFVGQVHHDHDERHADRLAAFHEDLRELEQIRAAQSASCATQSSCVTQSMNCEPTVNDYPCTPHYIKQIDEEYSDI
jgi:hypothetical protein